VEGPGAQRNPARGRRGAGASAGVLLAVALIAATTASAQPPRRAPSLGAQLEALRLEKARRSATERKLSARLLQAARRERGLAATPGPGAERAGVLPEADGRVLVDLRGEVTAELVAEIESRGGSLVTSQPEHGALRARVPLGAALALAGRPEVRRLRPADRAIGNAVNSSRGDVAHRAALARSVFGADGTGVVVGVLADGVDTLAARQASGDLPPGVGVLPGQAGSGDEGTAMLELVHDLAPGAQLLFATAFGGQASLAANVLALRAAGADVIVDDVRYPAEAVFQDDDVARAVEAVSADGALYVAAAGNSGSLEAGTSGVWEGDFVASARHFGPDVAHDFGGGVTTNPILVDSPHVFTLHWSDPLGASANDYDLLLLDTAGTRILASSTDVQDGDDDPIEIIDSSAWNDTGARLAAVKGAGAVRFLHLNAHRGRLGVATDGQIGGHAGAVSALAVVAVDARRAAGPGGVFSGSETVQSSSSDGPRRVFFAAGGSPLGVGPPSRAGGVLRAKPDLAGADCVATATPAYPLFCGSSAGAAHVAGLAALLLDLGAPFGAGAGSVAAALRATALDVGALGPDGRSGAGIADALTAADALHPLDCDDGLDNDGDGRADFPADPGCRDAAFLFEDPQCQDGVSNDADGLVDFDGGASALGAPLTQPDPQCSEPWRREAACGLGFELCGVLWLLRARRRAR
jgi:hypothetical protein